MGTHRHLRAALTAVLVLGLLGASPAWLEAGSRHGHGTHGHASPVDRDHGRCDVWIAEADAHRAHDELRFEQILDAHRCVHGVLLGASSKAPAPSWTPRPPRAAEAGALAADLLPRPPTGPAFSPRLPRAPPRA